jgi:hypothetical protein
VPTLLAQTSEIQTFAVQNLRVLRATKDNTTNLNAMKKQIIKTEEFFVENRDDKQSRILRIKDQMPEYFMNLAFKENRKVEQREKRQKDRLEYRMLKRIAISFKNENLSEADYREEIIQLSEHKEYIDKMCEKYF